MSSQVPRAVSRPGAIRRRVLRALLLPPIGLAFALVLAECVVRIVDPMGISYFRHLHAFQRDALRTSAVPGLWFEHVPGLTIDVGVPVRINSLGLRGGEVAQPKPKGVRRVLVLGDSVAFGWGVREEETFEYRLAATLSARGAGPVEVLNAGVLMYNTVQERLKFDARDAALEPDLVLLVYCNNDVLVAQTSPQPAPSGGARPAELDGLVSGLDWWLLTNSCRFALTDLLRQLTLERLTRVMGRQGGDDEPSVRRREVVRRYVESASAKIDAPASYAALAAIAKRCKELGVPFVVVPFGAPAELQPLCERGGIAYATEAEGVNRDPNCRLSRVDPHPNPEGHRQLAERIARALDRLGD